MWRVQGYVVWVPIKRADFAITGMQVHLHVPVLPLHRDSLDILPVPQFSHLENNDDSNYIRRFRAYGMIPSIK